MRYSPLWLEFSATIARSAKIDAGEPGERWWTLVALLRLTSLWFIANTVSYCTFLVILEMYLSWEESIASAF